MTLFATPPAAPDVRPVEPARPEDADPVLARLQERLAALETEPLDETTRSRTPKAPSPASVGPVAPEIQDLNDQLELLREQLEAAFDDVDARLAAADRRAAAAEERAEAADQRAAVASARAGNVLYAVDELAADLTRFVDQGSVDPQGLRSVVDKLRARLQP